MDNELFELCKEVSTRFPEWRDTDCVWYSNAGEVHDKRSVWHKNDVFDKPANVPLYTSDYLLEKLLPITPIRLYRNNDGLITLFWEPSRPIYDDVFADTPLKSLLKLVIALDDAKELK